MRVRSGALALGQRTGWFALMVAMATIMAGCGLLSPRDDDRTAKMAPAEIHAAAKEELDSGRYGEAVKLLNKLESRYPFGIWAQQAQLDAAFAHYKNNDRAQALIAIDRFIRLYPNHPRLDYAYYLKGLINFNDEQGVLQRLGGQDLAERDQIAAREAFEAFQIITKRFPNSVYAEDAQARQRYLRNTMAAGELYVAHYYFSRKAFIAAIVRAQTVVEQYDDTPASEEALALMIRAYDQLGMTAQRDDAQRVLQHNFPNSHFLKDASLVDRSSRWAFWR